MLELRWARWIVIAVFAFTLFVSGYALRLYYLHWSKAENISHQELQRLHRAEIFAASQNLWEKGLSEIISHSLRILPIGEEQISKGLKVIEASQPEVRLTFYIDADSIYLSQWRKSRLLIKPETLNISLTENPDFKYAEILEFQHKAYEDAVRIYEDFWLKNPGNYRAANALARCLFKMNAYDRSEKIYRQIYVQNPPVEDAEEGPLALIAAFQMLNIYLLTKQNEALQVFGTQVFSDLLEELWDLTPARAAFYKNRIRGLLAETASDAFSKTALERLTAREQELEKTRATVRMISERIIPFIEGSYIDQYKVYFPQAHSPGRSFLLIIPRAPGHLVLDLDYHRFIQQRILPAFPELAKHHPGIGLTIRTAFTAYPVSHSASPLAESQPLSKHFPDAYLDIFSSGQSQTALHRGLERSRRVMTGAYLVFAMVLLLILWVLLKQIQLAELKSDFVSHVSHELKTPLTSLHMFNEILTGRPNLPVKKRRQYYGIMLSETVRLSRLIENLLDISRLERRKRQYHFAPEELDDVLLAAADVFNSSLEPPGPRLALSLQSRVTLSLDKDAIIQMVINLLDNARKFSEPDRPLHLTSVREGFWAIVRVQDEGIGMTPVEQRRVFRKFYQSKRSYEDRFKGVGLGLTIVQSIVKAHHGKIILESRLGQGTTVTVHLPLTPA